MYGKHLKISQKHFTTGNVDSRDVITQCGCILPLCIIRMYVS